MARLLWLLCFVAGHHWRTVLVNISKMSSLMHLHPQAGCWSICRRCGKEWNDLKWVGPARGFDNIQIAPPQLEYMCGERCWCRHG